MRAVRFDMYLEAGADYAQTVEWDTSAGDPEADLTAWGAELQVRQRPWREGDTDLTNPVLLNFVKGAAAPNARLTLDAEGTVTVQCGGAVLDALAPWRNPASFDLLLTDPMGARTRLVQGRAVLVARVSA